MTDTTTTETRALIARVRATIAPTDQPQALRDLARTADGEPRVDAGMLRQEAASLEAGDDATLADYVRVAGSWGARRIAIPIDVAAVALGENDRLRARVAELEEKLAELEAETLSAATVIAQANSEAEEIHDRLSDVLGEAFGPHAPMSAAEIVDALEREIYQRREDLPMAYERGQEAMRERAARACFALAYGADWPSELEQAVCNAYTNAGAVIRALPLNDDARDDAQGQEVNER